MLADRSDIGEEISRPEDPLPAGGRNADGRGGGGRQEAGFSAPGDESRNKHDAVQDIGYRRGGLGITELALAAKADIEKIREQTLNLE